MMMIRRVLGVGLSPPSLLNVGLHLMKSSIVKVNILETDPEKGTANQQMEWNCQATEACRSWREIFTKIISQNSPRVKKQNEF